MKKVSEFLQETNKKISKATTHNYIKEFELGEKSDSGKVFLSDTDIEIIEKIYELSEDGNGKNTIRKKLELDKPKTGIIRDQNESKTVLNEDRAELRQEQDSLRQNMSIVFEKIFKLFFTPFQFIGVFLFISHYRFII